MRLLHVMLRVTDLEHSINFYTSVFNMKLLRRKDYPEGKFTLAFLGYGDESDHTVLELTHNWETDHYDIGNAYGHIAIGVEDVYAACKEAEKKGANVTRQPGPMKHGSTILAFIEDPDGYKVELLSNNRSSST